MKVPFRIAAFCGRFSTGKTLACADLLVMLRKSGVDRDKLLFIDTEGSVTLYTTTEFYRDMFKVVDARNMEGFLPFLAQVINGKETYTAIVIDTVEALQDVIVEKTWNDPNLSDAYKEKNTPFMWGRVKKEIGKILLKLCATKTEVLLMTSHARREFVGGRATGRFEGKLLDPIWNLCDFVAFLERRPNHRYPDAAFMPPLGKSRILALPPRIEDFTWTKLFKYVTEKPADWSNLKKEEMVSEGLELLQTIERVAVAGEETEESV